MAGYEQAVTDKDVDAAIYAAAKDSGPVAALLYQMCDEIGPRLAGTEADRRAAALVQSVFMRYGLDQVQLEPFPFLAWRRGAAATLQLLAPQACALPCYAMPYGAATGAAGVSGPWVDVGSGSAGEIERQGDRLRGAFALTDGTSGARKDIQRCCAAAGACGVLHGHTIDGMHFRTGSVADGEESPIAAVSIPAEVLARLRRVAGEGRLRLVVDCVCEPATTWNVVGEWQGCEYPDERVLVGGHYDSHDISPGAYDNGAGVAVVMEAARLLQPLRARLKRTLRFVAFGAEEMGLLGSHYHARQHAAALRRARLMLNCDTPCLGRPHGLAFHMCTAADAFLPTLASRMGEDLFFAHRRHKSSDHYAFLRQGVITAGLAGKPGASRGGAFYHMAADTPEKLVPAELADTAAFAARVLWRACQDDDWPDLRHDAGALC